MVKHRANLRYLGLAIIASLMMVLGLNGGKEAWAKASVNYNLAWTQVATVVSAPAPQTNSAPTTTTSMIGTCDGVHRTFFGLKPWYEYLEVELIDGNCEIAASNFSENAVASIWKIALTIVYDLNFVAVIAAVGMAIYAGIQYLMSSGDAGVATKARKALIDSLIGMAIVASAAIIVNVVLWIFA